MLRKNMPRDVGVFDREEQVLNEARHVLESCSEDTDALQTALARLSDEYEKLSRRSARLVTMSDRMQGALAELNRDLAVNEQKYRGIFENVAEGIFSCHSDGRLVEVNPALASMFGFSAPEVLLEHICSLSELFCCETARNEYEHKLRSPEELKRYEARMKGRYGTDLWVEISAAAVGFGKDGGAGGFVGVVADVTERRAMLEEMCRLARTDGLTGLWNRRYFLELGGRETARAQRSKRPLSLLMLDIDHFKNVNDTFGHDAGDEALKTVSRVLRDGVRESDIPARIGGEEFAVMMPETGPSEALGAARRICDAVRRNTVAVGKDRFSVTASIGLVVSREGNKTVEHLLKMADIALYDAKKGGRDRVVVHRP